MNTDKKFKNLIELSAYFSDEAKCVEHLEQLRWNGTLACPHCGGTRVYRLKQLKKYKCGEKGCLKRFSVTTGTFFESTKIPLSKWFVAMYLCLSHKKGVSSCQLARDLSVTQKTAWFILHRVRSLVTDKIPVMLEGIVEVDETYVGGKEKNKHKSPHAKAKRLAAAGGKIGRGYSAGDSKTVVFGLLERDGKVVNYVVPNSKGESLLPIIARQIKQGSTMYSDDLLMYRNTINLGFGHESVSHNQKEYVRGDVHTANIDGYWSQLKRGLVGVYHHASPKHLHRYCNEFAFRYNTRKNDEQERFDKALSNCDGRLKYPQLINKTGK